MKRILLCAAILAFPVPVTAQHVGLQAGGALTSQTAEEADTKYGLIGGVSLDLPLADAVGFRLGALYAQKGASFDEGGVEGTIELAYIELPAMLRLGGSVYALIGAAIGINSGCTVMAASLSIDCSEIPDASINMMDLGIAGGIGLRAGMSNRVSFTLEVLHNRGLSNVSDDDPDPFQNRAFNALAGLAITLGR